MNSHSAEIAAKAQFHDAARLAIERLTRRLQHLVDEREGS
jgi:hypothetical protein